MHNTSFASVPLPAIGAREGVAIARANQTDVRVELDNVGATMVFVATSAVALRQVTPAGIAPAVYRVLVGRQKVFVLAKGQTLFGLGTGAGGLVSVSVSDLDSDPDGTSRRTS